MPPRAVLLSVGLAVVSVLWQHELRTAELIRREHPDFELSFQASCGDGIVRSEGAEWYLEIPRSPKAVANPQRVESVLKQGTAFEVSVNGGFVARLAENDFARNRREHLAYLFEMRYRRIIENNDGRRIVERRSFQEVRMAKIISQASDMRLRPGVPGRPILDHLDYPGPASGIVVAPVQTVAHAMLANGADSVVADPSSRAFVEHDALSGKTVRLTFVDGVGVVSVEPIGWTLTSCAARFLLSQPVLHMSLVPPGDADEGGVWTVDLARLALLLDPSVGAWSGCSVSIEAAAMRQAGCDGYSLVRAWHDEREPQQAARAPLGVMQYDPSDGIITAASVNWSLEDIANWGERLLYERSFEADPVFRVRYQVRVD